jgi:hypothetical protein
LGNHLNRTHGVQARTALSAAEEFYKALLNKVRTAKGVNSLGADTEYWTQCANIVLRAKDEVLSR